MQGSSRTWRYACAAVCLSFAIMAVGVQADLEDLPTPVMTDPPTKGYEPPPKKDDDYPPKKDDDDYPPKKDDDDYPPKKDYGCRCTYRKLQKLQLKRTYLPKQCPNAPIPTLKKVYVGDICGKKVYAKPIQYPEGPYDTCDPLKVDYVSYCPKGCKIDGKFKDLKKVFPGAVTVPFGDSDVYFKKTSYGCPDAWSKCLKDVKVYGMVEYNKGQCSAKVKLSGKNACGRSTCDSDATHFKTYNKCMKPPSPK